MRGSMPGSIVRPAVAVCALLFLGACASGSEIAEIRSMAEQAQATADEAMSVARDAKATADRAMTEARGASGAAGEARSLAQQALGEARAAQAAAAKAEEKADRMFKKSVSK